LEKDKKNILILFQSPKVKLSEKAKEKARKISEKYKIQYQEIEVKDYLPETELSVPLLCLATKTHEGILIKGNKCTTEIEKYETLLKK